jgi:hypothetical protein
MIDALRSSETSVLTRVTRRHIPEDGILERLQLHHFVLSCPHLAVKTLAVYEQRCTTGARILTPTVGHEPGVAMEWLRIQSANRSSYRVGQVSSCTRHHWATKTSLDIPSDALRTVTWLNAPQIIEISRI